MTSYSFPVIALTNCGCRVISIISLLIDLRTQQGPQQPSQQTATTTTTTTTKMTCRRALMSYPNALHTVRRMSMTVDARIAPDFASRTWERMAFTKSSSCFSALKSATCTVATCSQVATIAHKAASCSDTGCSTLQPAVGHFAIRNSTQYSELRACA
jgi:hypothetical protein